jgi:hypothetical protein
MVDGAFHDLMSVYYRFEMEHELSCISTILFEQRSHTIVLYVTQLCD